MSEIDTAAAVMDRHTRDGRGDCSECVTSTEDGDKMLGVAWPCLPYRLAKALQRETDRAQRLASRALRIQCELDIVRIDAGIDPDNPELRLDGSPRNRTTGAAGAQQTPGGAEKSQELTTTDDK